MDLKQVKKRYSYYNSILKRKGSLTEQQQKAFDELKTLIGDNIPRTRSGKLTDEERKAKRREYYQSHKEHIKSYSAEWSKNNPDKVAAYNKKKYEKKSEASRLRKLATNTESQ